MASCFKLFQKKKRQQSKNKEIRHALTEMAEAISQDAFASVGEKSTAAEAKEELPFSRFWIKDDIDEPSIIQIVNPPGQNETVAGKSQEPSVKCVFSKHALMSNMDTDLPSNGHQQEGAAASSEATTLEAGSSHQGPGSSQGKKVSIADLPKPECETRAVHIFMNPMDDDELDEIVQRIPNML